MPLADVDDIPDFLPGDDAGLDILFVQSKRPDKIKQNDIVLFGNAVRTFLTLNQGDLLRLKPSSQLLGHWQVIHRLRQLVPQVAAAADIKLLFVYSGQWKDFQGVNIRRENVLADLSNALKSSRAEFEIWGLDQLQEINRRYGDGAVRTLRGIQLMPLPPGTASGYIGYVKAQRLVDFVSTPNSGRNKKYRTADNFMFLDNVRAFLGVDHQAAPRDNPGALGLKATLERGEATSIIAGHNGIVIVADKARELEDAIELTNAQIVNGCQSTHVLVSYSGQLEACYLPLKIVVTENEDLKDIIAIASNTQSEVDNYDILARLPNVKALELELAPDAVPLDERVWFQRRRNQRIDFPPHWNKDVWQRVIRPRHLLDAYASTVMAMPHTAHSDPRKVVNLARDGNAFNPEHEPMVYRALAWMIVTGRQWAFRHKRNWQDRYEYSGGKAYAARHQYIWALWNIAVPDPEAVTSANINRSRHVHDRFKSVLDQLMRNSDTLGDLAGHAVDNAVPSDRRLNADLVRTKVFTENIAEATAKLRPAPSDGH